MPEETSGSTQIPTHLRLSGHFSSSLKDARAGSFCHWPRLSEVILSFLPHHTSAFEACPQLWCCCWGPDSTTLLNAQSPAPGATRNVETLAGWLQEHPVRGVYCSLQPIPHPLLHLSAWWQPSARLEQCPGAPLVHSQGGLLQSKQPGPASVLSLI